MSAYVVHDEHIAALIHLALDHWRHLQESTFRYQWDQRTFEVTAENATEVGMMLLAENYRSVNHLYSDNPDPLPGAPFAYVRPRRDLTVVEALKAIDGYEYQACETADWRDSQACAFIDRLRARIIARVPGYRDAETWAITASFYDVLSREAR